MILRSLGSTGPRVGAIGLGCMGMSGLYGPADRAESIATVHAALEAGVTLLDTGDFYGMGHNELLLREALAGRNRDRVILSVKFGAQRGPDGAWLGLDTRPAAVKTALAYTLQRLGTDHVDVYRPARLDPAVPIEETVGAVADLVRAGHVRHLGLSEVGAETLRRAHAVHPVVDVQLEYSLVSRGLEAELLPAARALGIGVTAYGVLSRGLISGHWSAERALSPGDFRSHAPRFQGANLTHNLALGEALRRVATGRGVTAAQLAIAWVLSRGPDVVPLVGARTRERLAEALGALDLPLSAQELAAIEAAVPPGAVAGERYAPQQMAALDSERSSSTPSDREIVTRRALAWPRELVFRAWTEADHLARWWGPRGFSNTFETFEPRPGGAWRFVMHGPDGVDYGNQSVFVELARPERIVLQHLSDHRFQVTATFAERTGGTELTFRMRFETAAECARVRTYVVAANEENLDRLEAELTRMATPQ